MAREAGTEGAGRIWTSLALVASSPLLVPAGTGTCWYWYLLPLPAWVCGGSTEACTAVLGLRPTEIRGHCPRALLGLSLQA